MKLYKYPLLDDSMPLDQIQPSFMSQPSVATHIKPEDVRHAAFADRFCKYEKGVVVMENNVKMLAEALINDNGNHVFVKTMEVNEDNIRKQKLWMVTKSMISYEGSTKKETKIRCSKQLPELPQNVPHIGLSEVDTNKPAVFTWAGHEMQYLNLLYCLHGTKFRNLRVESIESQSITKDDIDTSIPSIFLTQCSSSRTTTDTLVLEHKFGTNGGDLKKSKITFENKPNHTIMLIHSCQGIGKQQSIFFRWWFDNNVDDKFQYETIVFPFQYLSMTDASQNVGLNVTIQNSDNSILKDLAYTPQKEKTDSTYNIWERILSPIVKHRYCNNDVFSEYVAMGYIKSKQELLCRLKFAYYALVLLQKKMEYVTIGNKDSASITNVEDVILDKNNTIFAAIDAKIISINDFIKKHDYDDSGACKTNSSDSVVQDNKYTLKEAPELISKKSINDESLDSDSEIQPESPQSTDADSDDGGLLTLKDKQLALLKKLYPQSPESDWNYALCFAKWFFNNTPFFTGKHNKGHVVMMTNRYQEMHSHSLETIIEGRTSFYTTSVDLLKMIPVAQCPSTTGYGHKNRMRTPFWMRMSEKDKTIQLHGCKDNEVNGRFSIEAPVFPVVVGDC